MRRFLLDLRHGLVNIEADCKFNIVILKGVEDYGKDLMRFLGY